jgi:membrane-associated phospholipid phosphatase
MSVAAVIRELGPVARPSRRGATLLAGLAVALAVLAVLVVSGTLTTIDQFSVDHLMPWLVPKSDRGLSPAGFYRPFSLDTPTLNKVLDLWTYPCSVLISLLVVTLTGYLLLQRLGPVAALAPAAAWLVGDCVEVLGKGVLTRPTLHYTLNGVRTDVPPFDDSFPSGHMMRGVIVAFAIAVVWPRAMRWVVLWAALVGPALVLQSAHTISDVVGGALVGLIMVTAVYPLVAAARSPAAAGRART